MMVGGAGAFLGGTDGVVTSGCGLTPFWIAVHSTSGSSRSGRSRLSGGICGSLRRSILVLAPRFIIISVGFPKKILPGWVAMESCWAKTLPSIATIIIMMSSAKGVRFLLVILLVILWLK